MNVKILNFTKRGLSLGLLINFINQSSYALFYYLLFIIYYLLFIIFFNIFKNACFFLLFFYFFGVESVAHAIKSKLLTSYKLLLFSVFLCSFPICLRRTKEFLRIFCRK